jgi:hypothetical protein
MTPSIERSNGNEGDKGTRKDRKKGYKSTII